MSKLKNVALFAFYDDANKLTKHKPNKDNYVRASVVIQEKETGKPLLMKEWWFDETDINTIYKELKSLKKKFKSEAYVSEELHTLTKVGKGSFNFVAPISILEKQKENKKKGEQS